MDYYGLRKSRSGRHVRRSRQLRLPADEPDSGLAGWRRMAAPSLEEER